MTFLFTFGSVLAQNNIRVQGVVVDPSGEAIIGASIIQSGTQNGVITDVSGNFAISVPQGSQLEVSCIGYISQTVSAASTAPLRVVLTEDTVLLEETVVIGYGTVKKSDLTGALSSVSSSSFEDQRVTRLDQALQGRASGVQVTSTVGAPGGDARIRVRGANSVLGDNSPLYVVDGFVGADFSSVNPNDIKSMEVLKDASSTAIYGSRGANGVILITTKSGDNSGRASVTYDGSITLSTIIKNYDLLSAGEYAETYNARQEAYGLDPYFTQSQIDEYYKTGGFDYVDEVLRTAVSHQHQLSVNGGNKKFQWRVSGNYLDQQGIVVNSDYERFNVNSSVKAQINDRLSFRFNVNSSSSTGKNNTGYSGAATILNQAVAWAPTTNPYNEDGSYVITDPVGSLKTNPMAILNDRESITEKDYLTLLAGAAYKILPSLTLDFQAGYDQVATTGKNFTGVDGSGSSQTSSASVSNSKGKTIQTTTQLTWAQDFNKHSFNVMGAVESQSYKYFSSSSSSTNLTFPSLKYYNLAQAETFSVSSGYSMWTLVSVLARANYSYDSRYLVTFSARGDGSSKFAKGNKWSFFPSAAVAWNVKNENFMENANAVSALKLRVSWGKTGSQAISPYATFSSFGSATYPFSMGSYTSGIQISDPANPDLSWETTEQWDAGIDIGLFNNRLNLEVDYYHKTTRDLLLNKDVANYQGGGSITSNIGSIRNTGVDFSITGKIIEKKDLTLESTFNFSVLRNKVLDLGEEEAVYVASNLTGINDGAYDFVYMVGEPLGTMWGIKYLGPWQADEAEEAALYGCVPGDARYEDLDGNYVYDSNDYQIIGHSMPKYTLGWNTNFTWKNLSVNMFFQGVFGLDKLNYNRCINMMASRDVRGARFSEVLDRYIPGENEDAWLPAWSSTSTWYPVSSLWVENGNYLRLKNLSVAYDFNIKKVGSFTISFNATNLFTITSYKGLDPEASNVGGTSSDIQQGIDYGAYPNARSYTFGVTMRF